MPTKTKKSDHSYHIFAAVLPSLIINAFFIVQALILDWRLGTMVWVYWLQGFFVILPIFIRNWRKLGVTILMLIMVLYGSFMALLTFPSDGTIYTKNGVQVAAQEFTVLSNTQWDIVLSNVALIIIGSILVRAFKKDKTDYSGIEVIKRLIPLHLTVLTAGVAGWSVLVFIILKSVFDVLAEYLVALINHHPRAHLYIRKTR